MKRTISQGLKRSVSAMLATAMSLSLFTAIPASAEIGKKAYNYDGYSVDYNVTNEWDGAQTVELTVSNTGTDSILNWALKYDAEGEINNLWNANLYEQNGSEYIIKNTGWNFEIAPNQSVTYGYTLNGSDLSLPDSFEIYSKRVEKTEGYDVSYNITKSWDTGVEGNIVISNTSNVAIEAWTLSFDSNFNVDHLWNGRVLENSGTSYTVAAEVWTNPVQPNSTMTIGFVGSKAVDVEAALSNFRLTEVVIGEGTPVIPIDPPVDDIEISANAALQENGDIAVSWTSNKQEGTFDILMSADGVNFTSVGTVTGVSEYLYTPESDFETLYFKVVQTVSEQSAQSNVVSVVNNKPSEDIVISANGAYDEESGDITVSWETNTDNGSFEIFMSEDGNEFVSIGTVSDVSEYVYDPATDFEEIYFKVIQTAGDRSAESNVVTVKSNIVLSVITSANYDEESGNIKVSWITSFDKGTYEILVSEDDENFTSIGAVENEKEFIYTPAGKFDVLYFKVKQTVSELTVESESAAAYYPIDWDDKTDTDNDGLADIIEKKYYETDPTNSDTDGDDLPDGYEVYTLKTDPAKADSDDNGISDGDEDLDSDGLSNFREYELGTDPNNVDSDNDGLSDSEEVNTYNTNPLKYDTDNDGVSDGDEIALGLDPNNATTDGTPDSERTFMQHVGEDSEIFSDINTTDNPFEVSIDVEAAGIAGNNLYCQESGYTKAVENSAIVGIAPELTYGYGLKINKVTVNFELKDYISANTNGKYAAYSDEFAGIKRFYVFKYFNDFNMLLPIETYYDTESNKVYATTDEFGTYCLVDMEIWLENLGVSPEEFGDETSSKKAASFRSVQRNTDQFEKDIDVVFIVYPWNDLSENVRPELSYISQKIINKANSMNVSVRIHYVNFLNDVLTSERGLPYAQTATEANEMSYRIPGINSRAFTSSDYPLYKSLSYVYRNLDVDLLLDSNRYCFVIDSNAEPQFSSVKESAEPIARDMKDNQGYEIYFACNKNNANYSNYSLISSDALCHEISITDIPSDYVNDENIRKRYNFGDFVYDTIFEEQLYAITATGWNQVKLNSNLQQNYEWYLTSKQYSESDDEEEKNKKVPGAIDTDSDKVFDYEEIKFEKSTFDTDNNCWLVNTDNPDKVELYTLKEILDLAKGRYFYVENGLDKLKKKADKDGVDKDGFPNSLKDKRILPINSDPTKKDSDKDLVPDGVDLNPLKFIPTFVDKGLDTDEIIWYYNVRKDIIPTKDEHGNLINGSNRENTVTRFFFDEYVVTRNHSQTFSEWAESTYGLSDLEIYINNSYNQIMLGNAYDGPVTILGSAGSLILGFTPFGVICDVRDITVDLMQFDANNGLNQGAEWYLQAVPDFLGIVPVVGDICKQSGDSLSLLSKSDASKIVNYAISDSLDESGELIKSSDEIAAEIKEEAEAIIKQTDYKKTDDIIDSIGKSETEKSAFEANETLKKDAEIAEEAKLLDNSSVKPVTSKKEIYRKGKKHITELTPNIKYKTKSGQIYTTGPNGEIISVSGSLSHGKGKRNPYAQRKAGRESRITDPNDPDDGGHLIATIFGGDGGLDNLVPMNRNLNRGAWENMEDAWSDILKRSDVSTLDVEIQMSYADSARQLRPTEFEITTKVKLKDGSTRSYKTVFNNSAGQKFDRTKFDILT